jgi:phosphohistidine phosphatase
MNLHILRHASAGTPRPNPVLDLKRPLDKEGKEQCLRLAHVLNAMKIGFDAVYSSPLKRSLQTAQLVATETGYEAQITTTPALAPDARFADFLQLVHDVDEFENVLLVGHNPNLQNFLGSLLAWPPREEKGPKAALQIRLRKGSIARVSMDRGPATLTSLLDPRVVRTLYATSTTRSRPKTSRK